MTQNMTRLHERQMILLGNAIGHADVSTNLIADEADVSQRTVQYWLAGDSLMQLPHITRLLRSTRIPDPIKHAINTLLLEGTGMSVTPAPDATDLDANGDGRVDGMDALSHLATACEFTGNSSHGLVQALADGTIDEDEYTQVRRNIVYLQTASQKAIAAMDAGFTSQTKRRGNLSGAYKFNSTRTKTNVNPSQQTMHGHGDQAQAQG